MGQQGGELVERGTYQAYGGVDSDYRPDRWKGFREDYRFTGKEEDIEVGLQYFGKRFYNPLLQRWISADPLAIHVPVNTSLNLYAYVDGTVLKNTDPLGLCYGTNSCGSGYSSAPKVFDTILDTLDDDGLPTRFMKALSAKSGKFQVREGSENAYSPFWRRVTYTKEVIQDLESAVRRSSTSGGSVGVGRLYHESTHGYLDKYGSTGPVKQLIEKGRAHFAGARLKNGGTVSDTMEVFHEAAAGYVGRRAEALYEAKRTLDHANKLFEAGNVAGAQRLVGAARRSYNDAVKQTVFGYETVNGEQVEVEKPLSKEARAFLDGTILEGRVKQNFDAVSEFSDVAKKIESAKAPADGK